MFRKHIVALTLMSHSKSTLYINTTYDYIYLNQQVSRNI